MRDLLILVVHLLVTVAKLLRPGGARAVAAESLLLKHQQQSLPKARPESYFTRSRCARIDIAVREPRPVMSKNSVKAITRLRGGSS